MRFILFLVLLVGSSVLSAQTSPAFISYPVTGADCHLLLPAKPDTVELSYSPDSSRVYTIECLDSSTGTYFHWGALVVRLNGIDLAAQENEMLVSYLGYLQTAFNITEASTVSYGLMLPTHPTAKGVSVTWTDGDGDRWSVVAWGAESTMIVQFVYGPRRYPSQATLDTFFAGARFPGE